MHKPVLLKETVDSLAVKPGGVYIDGTLGRAGHAREILARAGTGARLVGIDRDTQALTESAERLEKMPGVSLTLVHGCHGDIAQIVRDEGFDAVDGVLLDLGVSSPQLDEADRGFSFRADGPLDMRMDQSRGETAADLVATRSEDELAGILRMFGEEPNARRIAKAIVRARAAVRIETTAQLAELVEKTVGRSGAHHPATRTFQALRMAVNYVREPDGPDREKVLRRACRQDDFPPAGRRTLGGRPPEGTIGDASRRDGVGRRNRRKPTRPQRQAADN